MDYGHRLEFGAFLTPSAADPQASMGLGAGGFWDAT